MSLTQLAESLSESSAGPINVAHRSATVKI